MGTRTLFAVLDGTLYIDQALIDDNVAGKLQVGVINEERFVALSRMISGLTAQIQMETTARISAIAAISARLDAYELNIRPD